MKRAMEAIYQRRLRDRVARYNERGFSYPLKEKDHDIMLSADDVTLLRNLLKKMR